MADHDLDFIMLFSTTQRFLNEHKDFIDALCNNLSHRPIINASEDDSCENGIVFDVEYKALMSNGSLVEIGTFQIDEGATGFAYDIRYNNKPVTTVHAVFFASSVERTIFTYCDKTANSDYFLPDWLAPVQYRIIPASQEYCQRADEIGNRLLPYFRTEVDDTNSSFHDKFNNAKDMMIENIVRVGNNVELYNWNNDTFEVFRIESITENRKKSFEINQFAPLRLSESVI